MVHSQVSIFLPFVKRIRFKSTRLTSQITSPLFNHAHILFAYCHIYHSFSSHFHYSYLRNYPLPASTSDHDPNYLVANHHTCCSYILNQSFTLPHSAATSTLDHSYLNFISCLAAVWTHVRNYFTVNLHLLIDAKFASMIVHTQS